jgi:hypothetical protein
MNRSLHRTSLHHHLFSHNPKAMSKESSMSSLAPENLLSAQKAGLDASFGLASRAFEGFEKLADLNAQTLRAVLAEHQEMVAKSLSARDPQAFFSLQNQHLHSARSTRRRIGKMLQAS